MVVEAIPFGKLTIIQGDPGEGKTTFSLWLPSLLTQGRCFDEAGQPYTDKPCKYRLSNGRGRAG